MTQRTNVMKIKNLFKIVYDAVICKLKEIRPEMHMLKK